ncbi:hypothetical protein CCHL11_03650 [Colletotrichum chlorophyti]|uniref:Uncharacterized protein n=1 Tax=Colletotrichum chlorophyti TaxID=708187 RepID=A0A1Q8RSN2_9PEZI|nr:hypothetical protein CCHL11_03650 [Colletotrichum chlorophyti]
MRFSTLTGAIALFAGLATASPVPQPASTVGKRWDWCPKTGDRCTNILGGIGGCVCGTKLDPRYDCVCI